MTRALPPSSDARPRRHPALSAFLALLMTLNAIVFCVFLAFTTRTGSFETSILLSMAVCAANIACLTAIWRWKRAGFYGVIGVTLVSNIIVLASQPVLTAPSLRSAALAWVFVGLLWGLLRLGGGRGAWFFMR